MKNVIAWAVLVILILGLFVISLQAQTTSFSYQGKLTDLGQPASGAYIMEFKLFSSSGGTDQIGSTISNVAVTATGGIFTTRLDFGANAFPGADRFLEIAVKRNAVDPFIVLSPRQFLASSPYSIRTLKAASADSLSASCVLCVTDAQIDTLSGSKVTGTVASAATAAAVSGIVPVANGGTGSSIKNFVDLSTDQTSITGNKTFNGAITVSGAGVFNGNGSGLTNLNGGNLAPGSVTTASLASDLLPDRTLRNLATLRWDLLKGQVIYAVDSPSAIAFDGANMWITNRAANTVTKMRSSDGVILGAFPVGTTPTGVAFDGANMWITNRDSNNVTKLRASDGTNLGTFAVGTTPEGGIAFDGVHIWVSNAGTNNVTKLRASDGANLGTVAVGSSPRGVTFDGTNIWVANNQSGNVTRFRASDGAFQINFPVLSAPVAMAFDGENMWVANSTFVTKLRGDGANLGDFAMGSSVLGVAFDGTNIWASSLNGGFLRKFRTSDGTVLSHVFPAGGTSGFADPTRLAFDGTHMWVISLSTSNTVTRLAPTFSKP